VRIWLVLVFVVKLVEGSDCNEDQVGDEELSINLSFSCIVEQR